MTDTVLAQLAALKTAPIAALKQQWRDLFETEPPPYNRRFLEHRLAYRIQELAYGGLKPETLKRLRGARRGARRRRSGAAPAARQGPADRRHAADPRVPGRRALRDGARRGFRISGPAVQIAVRRSRAPSPARAGTGLIFFGLKNRRARVMKKPVVRKLRCAVYTRKSSEEGLEQEFNSLDAQREACEAYIASQKPEGWLLVPDRYDDGGISGATLERPALQRLLADIEARRVDVVVVYKIDRLSRALMDFAKLVEVFDRNNVTFVSVTQSFNTTTSMGRLTLNILLSFAQFEREVIGERIRDKFAASRKKGMWMGGFVPLGYDVKDRKLVVNEAEAATVRMIFERFIKIGSATDAGARRSGPRASRGKQGKLVDKGYLYKLLNNRVYIGEAVHKGTAYPGEHQAIIDQRALGQGARHPAREPAQARRTHAGADAGAAEGPDLRADRPGDDADAHPQGRQALPLLRLDRRAQTRCRGMPGAARAGGRDRERGRRPVARLAARARDHRRARGARRGNRWTASPRPRCARRWSGSIRSGTSCSRPSRRASSSCSSSGSMSARTAPTSGCGPRG